MSDQPATPATTDHDAPGDRPIMLVTDEAALVPAHLLAALTAPAPEGTANPDPAARAGMAGRARDEVIDAHAALLGEIHDIDFHHYTDGGMAWLYSGQPVEQIAQQALRLAERVTQAACDARATIAAATARRDWLTSGRSLRCLGCGEVIDPSLGEWRVCRGTAEHDWCHHDDPATEDLHRAATVELAEYDAHSEDRIRSGGPYPGDVIEVTYPGRSLPITAIWETNPDHPERGGRARIDTSGHILHPDGTTSPVPGHEHPDLLDLTAATGILIIHTREDLQAEADPVDDPEPTDLADEEVAWVGRPGDYDPNGDEARDDDTGPTVYDCGWGL